MNLKWVKTEDYLIASTPNFKFNTKLAMFDLDGTLITPKIGKPGRGKNFSINSSDWKFNFPNVKSILTDYEKNNYSIIIISNQGGISIGKQTFEDWSDKLNQVCKELETELYVFCSIDNNKYRKPCPTWFNEFVPKKIQENLDRTKSFYCGDACGRKGDFSDTDYKFALNCMIKFKTPENFFTGEIIMVPSVVYPNLFQSNVKKFKFVPSNEKEIILMVGYQGSGKSFIAQYIQLKFDYVVINQDTLKTKEKCIAVAEQFMKKCQPVTNMVIDQTNSNKETRKLWINLAQKYNYKVRVILMTTSKELSKHNNYFRHITTGIKLVPDIAYRIYKSKFVGPQLTEGISEIMEAHCSKPKDCNYYLFLY